MPIATEQEQEQEQEPQFCDNCGDRVPTRDDEGHGPCCHDLPHPWHCGPDGLYNRTSVSEDYEEEDEEERPSPPTCAHCGSTEWRVTVTQCVDTSNDEEPDGITIWFDWSAFDSPEATCVSCGMEMPGRFDLDPR